MGELNFLDSMSLLQFCEQQYELRQILSRCCKLNGKTLAWDDDVDVNCLVYDLKTLRSIAELYGVPIIRYSKTGDSVCIEEWRAYTHGEFYFMGYRMRGQRV